MRINKTKLIITFFVFFNYWGVSQPNLTEIETYDEFALKLKAKPVQELGKVIYNESNRQKVKLIIEELLIRNDSQASLEVSNYKSYHEENSRNWKTTIGYERVSKGFSMKVLALIEITLAKYYTNNNEKKYIDSLDSLLLTNKNPFLIEGIANELGFIASDYALLILKKHLGLRISIEYNIFRIETKSMTINDLIRYALISAQEKIYNNNDSESVPLLVSERSLLANERDQKSIMKTMEKEFNTPIWEYKLDEDKKKHYLDFISEMISYCDTRIKRESKMVSPIKKDPLAKRRKTKDFTTPTSSNVKRIEDQFLYLEDSSNSDLLNVLERVHIEKIYSDYYSNREDIGKLRQAAKILGDRHLNGSFTLTRDKQIILEKIVEFYLELQSSHNDDDITEATNQMYRLWSLAAPTLLRKLGAKSYFNFSSQVLNTMKNEEIIQKVIIKASSVKTKEKVLLYFRFLNSMQKQKNISIEGRPVLGKDETKALFEKLIVPALESLKEKVK
jgi:hypothetical protein